MFEKLVGLLDSIPLSLTHFLKNQNKEANLKTIKTVLKNENPKWNIPDRRLKKLIKAQTMSESHLNTGGVHMSKRFLLGKTASALFRRHQGDNATAPLDDAPPAMVEIPAEPADEENDNSEVVKSNETVVKDDTPQPEVATEEPVEERVAIVESPDAAKLYKDDNDGKRDDCAICQSCSVM